jgi:hypothetical protein
LTTFEKQNFPVLNAVYMQGKQANFNHRVNELPKVSLTVN